MSEVLSTASSEINQTVMKLSNIKQDLSQLKQFVRRNDLQMWQWEQLLALLTDLQTFKFLVDKGLNQEKMLCVNLRKLTYPVTLSSP